MIDARSDIFSFGSVLYEMLTGRRAFQSDTKASTIAAILKEEPKPPSQIVEGLPREVERIVRRCLRKDPEQRFQTMADLKVALAEAKEESDSGVLESTKTTTPKRRRMLLWVSAVAALLAAGVWFVRSKTATPEPSLVAVPLTSYPGTEDTPSFSPDGTQVAFQWCPENSDKSCHIYIKQVGVEPPFQLTNNPAQDFSPAWSPDGQTIAFLRILTHTKWGLNSHTPAGRPRTSTGGDRCFWGVRLDRRLLPGLGSGLEMDRSSRADRTRRRWIVAALGRDR
jgi:serine/threonine protein kinase